jgi:hypothetical protein
VILVALLWSVGAAKTFSPYNEFSLYYNTALTTLQVLNFSFHQTNSHRNYMPTPACQPPTTGAASHPPILYTFAGCDKP